MKQKALLLVSVVLVLFMFLSTFVMAFTVVPVKKISLNKTSFTLRVGDYYTLKVSFSPTNATKKLVNWSSSNSKTASVNSKGRVSAQKVGTATITAKTANGKSAKCTVTVVKKKEPVHISMLLNNSSAKPFNEDAQIFKIIEQKTNVKLDLQLVPEANFPEKANIMMATGDLPDVMETQYGQAMLSTYAKDGVILCLSDLIDKYGKNIKRFLTPEQVVNLQADDKKVYALPRVYDGDIYYLGWFARDDIMKQLKINPPETLDEFYYMLKTIKAKYPESTPLVLRQPILMALMCSWGVNESTYFRNGKFEMLGIRQEDKECVQFVNKLYTEKLIDPEFAMTSTDQWVEKISNNKGFVTWDYITRCEFFIDALSKTDPSFSMSVLPYPKAHNNIKPNAWVPGRMYVEVNYVFGKKTKVAEAAMKMFDFLYSDEGIELLNWGIEGKTFSKQGGTKKFLPSVKTASNPSGTLDIVKDYNIQAGLMPVINTDAYALFNLGVKSGQGFSLAKQRNYGRPQIPNVIPYITTEENDKMSAISTSLSTCISENLMKFMLGQRPISEWNDYVNEVKNLKIDEYLQIMNNAYTKMKGK